MLNNMHTADSLKSWSDQFINPLADPQIINEITLTVSVI